MTEIAIDFLFISTLFAAISPLIVSLLKNIGGAWPKLAKQATAVAMAIIGSFIAVGVSAGWSAINLGDWSGFWQPLIVGVGGIFAVQYASYMAIWKDTTVETKLADVGA
jgi:hypothetical protein